VYTIFGIIYLFFSSFLSVPHTFLAEGVVLGLSNFAQSFKSQNKIRFGAKQNVRGNLLVFSFSAHEKLMRTCMWDFHDHNSIATE
jgi:hypothetical protein